MKRLFLICTLLFLFSVLSAATANISIKTAPDYNSFVSTIKNDREVYMVSITGTKDGFKLKMPATLSLYSDDWYIGEIKKSGLLGFITLPSCKMFNAYKTKPFQIISTPSLVPGLSGIAKSFKNMDLATFSPLFSPSSPNGFYFDVNTSHVYFGFLMIDFKNEEAVKLMTDWKDEKISGKNAFSIIGYEDSIKKGSFIFDYAAFLQYRYRENFGLTGALGWSMKTGFPDFAVEVHRMISDNDSDEPIEQYGYNLLIENIKVGYIYKLYGKPVFGGTAQRKSAEFILGWKNDVFGFSVSSQIEGDYDTGHSARTGYSLDLDLKDADIGFDMIVNRLADSVFSIKSLELEAKINDCKFCIDDAKYSLSISWNEDLFIFNQPINLKISVNESREYTMTAKLILY